MIITLVLFASSYLNCYLFCSSLKDYYEFLFVCLFICCASNVQLSKGLKDHFNYFDIPFPEEANIYMYVGVEMC